MVAWQKDQRKKYLYNRFSYITISRLLLYIIRYANKIFYNHHHRGKYFIIYFCLIWLLHIFSLIKWHWKSLILHKRKQDMHHFNRLLLIIFHSDIHEYIIYIALIWQFLCPIEYYLSQNLLYFAQKPLIIMYQFMFCI